MNCSGASSFSNPPDPKAMRRFLEGVELRSVVCCSDCSLVGEDSLDLCSGRPPVVLPKETRAGALGRRVSVKIP